MVLGPVVSWFKNLKCNNTQALSPPTSEESWFFMRTGQKFERIDETKEGMSLEATATIDADLQQALTDADTGILKPGLLPKLDAATSSGSKELLSAITQAAAGLVFWWDM